MWHQNWTGEVFLSRRCRDKGSKDSGADSKSAALPQFMPKGPFFWFQSPARSDWSVCLVPILKAEARQAEAPSSSSTWLTPPSSRSPPVGLHPHRLHRSDHDGTSCFVQLPACAYQREWHGRALRPTPPLYTASQRTDNKKEASPISNVSGHISLVYAQTVIDAWCCLPALSFATANHELIERTTLQVNDSMRMSVL